MSELTNIKFVFSSCSWANVIFLTLKQNMVCDTWRNVSWSHLGFTIKYGLMFTAIPAT